MYKKSFSPPASSGNALSLESSFSSTEMDVGSAPPMSPTDRMLSPCTKKLMGKKAHKPVPFGKRMFSKQRIQEQYSLAAQVRPRRCPCPSKVEVILGSSSENRKEVMDAVQWEHRQLSPDIDEKAIRCDDPLELPVKIAKAKAAALIDRLRENDAKNDDAKSADMRQFLLITADQIVLFNNQVREKPTSEAEAHEFLKSYSSQSVSTASGVVVTHFPSLVQESSVDVATVYWSEIPDDAVERVVSRGKIFSSAGGFRIEDPELNPLVQRIDGSVDSVFGLPITLTDQLMREVLSKINPVTGTALPSATSLASLSTSPKASDGPSYAADAK